MSISASYRPPRGRTSGIYHVFQQYSGSLERLAILSWEAKLVQSIVLNIVEGGSSVISLNYTLMKGFDGAPCRGSYDD